MLQLAQLSDLDRVNDLARQVHELHVSWRPDIYEMPEELFPEDRFRDEIQNRQLYVAKIDDSVIGFVMIRIRESNGVGQVYRKILVLDQICVDESCRNRGIGTMMMQDVHALAKAFGCTDMHLGVYPQNDDAIAFYQKCGFTIRSIDMQRKV